MNFFPGEGWAGLDADRFDVKMLQTVFQDLPDAHLNQELVKVKLDQLRRNAAEPASAGECTANHRCDAGVLIRSEQECCLSFDPSRSRREPPI